RLDLLLDLGGHVPDARDVADRRSAELHDDARHGPPRARAKWAGPPTGSSSDCSDALSRQGGRIHTRARQAPQASSRGARNAHAEAMIASTSVDAREIERFSGLAERWWDPEGPMRPLHRLNPPRLAYL